jgi:multisubunit Na+/H+ antiporter MnhB subunit
VTPGLLGTALGAVIAAVSVASLVLFQRLEPARRNTRDAVAVGVLGGAGLILASTYLLPRWQPWLALAVLGVTSTWFLVSQLRRWRRGRR